MKKMKLPTKQEIGFQIYKYRIKAGLSLSQLAKEIAITPTSLFNIETGINYPRFETLYKLALRFDTFIDEVIKGKLK